MNTITISFNKKEKDRLSRIALRYGLSLPEFSHKILSELNEVFPAESFEDYDNPKEAWAEFTRALQNLKAGRAKTRV